MRSVPPKTTYHAAESILPDTGLRRMKFWATLWLVLAALLFAVATLLRDYHPVFDFLRAFAEGSLVGGLADWFAVTALFSHPLGLPIPHTAIIPRRKDEIGLRLGSFIQTHFLRANVVRSKLAEMRITERVLNWLASERGSRAVVAQSAALITWVLRSLEDEKIKQFLMTHLLGRLAEVEVAPILGDLLGVLTAHGNHQELFDKGISVASDLFEEYKPRLKQKMQEATPWWARILQGIAYRRLIRNVSEMLQEMKVDPNHEARQRFDAFIAKLVEDLHHSPELRQRCEEIKEKLLQDPAVQGYFEGLWSEIKTILLRHCSDPSSQVQRSFAEWVQATVVALRQEAEIMSRIERTFQIVVSRAIQKYRHEVGGLIAQEVERWDAEATSRLIETHIGKDLQWIRINGTVVGGLAGLLIYLLGLGLSAM